MYKAQDTQVTAALVRKAFMSQFGSQALSALPGFGLSDTAGCPSLWCVLLSQKQKQGFVMELKVQHLLGRHSRQHLSAAPQHKPTPMTCHSHCSHHVVPGTMSLLRKMGFGKSRWNCTLTFSRKNKFTSWQHPLVGICYICFLTEIRKWNYNISM